MGDSTQWIVSSPTLSNELDKVFYLFAENECLSNEDNTFYDNYSQIKLKSLQVANKLFTLVPRRSAIGILGENSAEWIISDISCCWNDYISVGLHTSWDENKISTIIKKVEMRALLIDNLQLDKVISAINQLGSENTISTIIIFQKPKAPKVNLCKQNNITISYLEEIYETPEDQIRTFTGVSMAPPTLYSLHNQPENPKEISTIIFTSGTSGEPKGVVISKKRRRFEIQQFPFNGCDLPITIVCHNPLAHGSDRGLSFQALHAGGRVAFSSSEHEQLMKNVSSVKPRVFLGLSHFWHRVYIDFINDLSNAVFAKTKDLLLEMQSKHFSDLNALDIIRNNAWSEWVLEMATILDIKSNKIKEVRNEWFGGKLFTPITGGSYTSPRVISWMKEVFSPLATSGETQGSRVQDSYGTSEFPGISCNGEINESIHLKLIDVPELGYVSTDTPHPRGEIVVRYKDKLMNPVYLRSTEKEISEESLNDWYHTGDIGSLDYSFEDHPRGKLSVIDRKSNLLELYVGGDSVWVQVEKLEKDIYGTIPQINQLCLLADRNEDGMIAIIGTDVQLDSHVDREQYFLDIIAHYGRDANVKSYEIPVGVIVEENKFSLQNGTLTQTGKLNRSVVLQKYKEKMDKIYSNRATKQEIRIGQQLENTKIPAFLDEVKNRIVSSIAKPEPVKQDTSCSDFIDFRFQGQNEKVTGELNEILMEMVEYVQIIRKENKQWSSEITALVTALENEVKGRVSEINKATNEELAHLLVQVEQLDQHQFTSSGDTTLTKILDLFSERQLQLVKIYLHLQQELGKGHARKQEIINKYGTSLDRCMELAERNNIRVPYQIWACGWWKDPNQPAPAEDDANVLTTALGKAEVYCRLTGERIEKDVADIGVERYHCLDLMNYDHSKHAHEYLVSLICTLEKVGGNHPLVACFIRELHPHRHLNWVVETAHFWHLRTSIDPSNSPIPPGEFFKNACKSYNRRLALGIPINPPASSRNLYRNGKCRYCKANSLSMVKADGYSWVTYNTLFRLSKTIAKVLFSRCGVQIGDRIGICGYNTLEWSMCDFACALLGCVSVGMAPIPYISAKSLIVPRLETGMHTTNNNEMGKSIINRASMRVILTTADRIENDPEKDQEGFNFLQILKDCKSVEHLFVVDKKLDELKNLSEIRKHLDPIQFHSMLDETENANLKSVKIPSPANIPMDGIATLLFTSGSSGEPKGVIVTAESFYNDISERVFVEPLITISYIPLSHSSDRMKIWEFLGNGGRIGLSYYSPDNWLAHERDKKNEMVQDFGKGSNNVLELFKNQVEVLRPTAMACPPRIWNGLFSIYNDLVNNENPIFLPESDAKDYIRRMFGDRIKFIITGGAPTAKIVLDFITDLFPLLSFADSYGATECGAITTNGTPVSSKFVQVKLAAVPSLNLLGDSLDNAVGNVGEILVHSPNLSIGYFADEKRTKEAFGNGWYKTGDIGKRTQANKYEILGRVNGAMFFNNRIIFPSTVESLLETSRLVHQLFIFFKGTQIIAVVVPRSKDTTLDDITSDFKNIANNTNLDVSELPSKIIVFDHPWTRENGFLTDQLKLARFKLEEYFSKQI